MQAKIKINSPSKFIVTIFLHRKPTGDSQPVINIAFPLADTCANTKKTMRLQ